MSISPTNFAKSKISVSILESRLENFEVESHYKNLPDDIKESLRNFIDGLHNYQPTINKDKYQTLSDIIINEKGILDIIVEASGYTKWSMDEKTSLTQEEIDYYKDKYGVAFSQEVISQYRFFRSVQDRDEINMITVTGFPGYFYVMLDTRRANFDIEGLINSKEMLIELKKHFD